MPRVRINIRRKARKVNTSRMMGQNPMATMRNSGSRMTRSSMMGKMGGAK